MQIPREFYRWILTTLECFSLLLAMKKVTAPSFNHDIFRASAHEIFFSRSQNYEPDQVDIDVYGNFWSFLFADISPPGLAMASPHSTLTVQGPVGLLIPPHQVVQWQVRTSHLNWFAYCTDLPYPSDLPTDIQAFFLTQFPTEVTPSWILNLLKTHPSVANAKKPDVNPHAQKLKDLLDREYKDNRPLADYAAELGLSKEWLIRYFKKSYFVTPIEYRNKKRLMQAFFELHSCDEKILALSHDVGFNDLKQFNSLFKKVLQLTPSQLKP